MIRLRVDPKSFTDLIKVVKEKIVIPKLNQISRGVEADISKIGEQFRGATSPSIADKGSTFHLINKGKMSARIKPIPGTEHTFKVNRDGEPGTPKWVDIDSIPGLRTWVDHKMPGYTHNRLKIRGKDATNYPVPLGHPDRDMFGISFKNLIGSGRTKYGLE